MKSNERFTIQDPTDTRKSYMVAGYTLEGKQVRKRFKTYAEASAYRHELEVNLENDTHAIKPRRTRLTDEQLRDAESAVESLDGMATLLQAVEFFKANWQDSEREISLMDAIPLYQAYKESKIVGGSLDENMRILRKFAGLHKAAIVNEITPWNIDDFLAGKKPTTKNTERGRLSDFFKWATRQRYCKQNPVELTEPDKVIRDETEIFSTDTAKALLKAARTVDNGAMLPWLVVGLFCGLRPESEAMRLEWADVDLKEKHLIVKGANKTKRRRVVELEDNAVAWLKECRGMHFKPKFFRGSFNRLKRATGFKPDKRLLTEKEEENLENLEDWISDGLRHTAVSNHLAFHGDDNKTALWAGHSTRILHRDYKGLVTKSKTKAFWAITPENVGQSNVIDLDKAKKGRKAKAS